MDPSLGPCYTAADRFQGMCTARDIAFRINFYEEDFIDFWDWLAMRRTCHKYRSSLKYRSKLLDGQTVTLASMLDWDCDQLREFFFVSSYAGTVIEALVPYADKALAVLSPNDSDDVRQNFEDILQGRNVVGTLPDAELVQQLRDGGDRNVDRLCGGHFQAKRAYWYQGMWLIGRELADILLDSEAPPESVGSSGVGSDANMDVVIESSHKAAEAPYSWGTVVEFPEHLLEFLVALDRGDSSRVFKESIFHKLHGSGSLRITRHHYSSDNYFRSFLCRNRPEHVSVADGDVDRAGNRSSHQTTRSNTAGGSTEVPWGKSFHYANPRGKWSRFLYCLVDTYASPALFASNAKLLLDKRFVSLLSREFPVVALKLLGYRCVDGDWCRHRSQQYLAARRDHAILLRRLSFDCVCNPAMLSRKGLHSYRPVDVSDEMRELVNIVLFSRERMLLNRQPRERETSLAAVEDDDEETSGSDDDAEFESEVDYDEFFGEPYRRLTSSWERNRRERNAWRECSYLKVLSSRDAWEQPLKNQNGPSSFEQRCWRRDALGFINRVCAEGPLDYDGTSELRTVILTPLIRLLDSDWRDLALRFVQMYGDYLQPHIAELPSAIVLSTYYEPSPSNAKAARRQIWRGERRWNRETDEHLLFHTTRLEPANLEGLDELFEELEDSDGDIDEAALKLFVQAHGRSARRVLAWKVREECAQAKHERSLEALEAFRIKLDALSFGADSDNLKLLEDEFKATLQSHWLGRDRNSGLWRCETWGQHAWDCLTHQEISLHERLSHEIKWRQEAAATCQDYARLYELFGHTLGCINCEGAEVDLVDVATRTTSPASSQRVLPRESPNTRLSKLTSTERFKSLVEDRGFHLVPALRHLGERFDKASEAFRDDVRSFIRQLDQGAVQVVDSESDDDLLH